MFAVRDQDLYTKSRNDRIYPSQKERISASYSAKHPSYTPITVNPAPFAPRQATGESS